MSGKQPQARLVMEASGALMRCATVRYGRLIGKDGNVINYTIDT